MDTKRGKMFGEVTDSLRLCKPDMVFRKFYRDELEFLSFEDTEVVGYWERLKHQYAGMAMQGMMAHTNIDYDEIVDLCVEFAHALVEKMKEKEERK